MELAGGVLRLVGDPRRGRRGTGGVQRVAWVVVMGYWEDRRAEIEHERRVTDRWWMALFVLAGLVVTLQLVVVVVATYRLLTVGYW